MVEDEIFQWQNLDGKRTKNYFHRLFFPQKPSKIPYFTAFLPNFGRFWFHMKHTPLFALFHVKHMFLTPFYRLFTPFLSYFTPLQQPTLISVCFRCIFLWISCCFSAFWHLYTPIFTSCVLGRPHSDITLTASERFLDGILRIWAIFGNFQPHLNHIPHHSLTLVFTIQKAFVILLHPQPIISQWYLSDCEPF